MPSSNTHGSPIPFASFRRPIMTLRSDQVHSEMSHTSEIPNFDSFQRQVSAQFQDLSTVGPDELLSISWIHKLLDAFITCQEDFRALLSNNKSLLSKPPADRLVGEYFDRAIKAMDIFNATRDGIETIRQWQKHLEIIICALDITQQRSLSEGHFRRARKSLIDLAFVMLDDKDNGSIFSQRNRSFGRKGKDQHQRTSSSGHSRSLSWSVSHNWSASKQLQSIANNLSPPRANEVAATSGLALLTFSMSFVLMFVLWVLIAAIPCQDRSVQVNFTIPRQFSWSAPLSSLHGRIVEESKKRERRNSNGLLCEIHCIEKIVQHMMDLVDSPQFPLSEEFKNEVKDNVEGLSAVCEACKTGLDPLERKLRETFRMVMSCRNEGLDLLGKSADSA